MLRSLAELNRLSAEKRARMNLPDEDPSLFFARRRAEDLRAGYVMNLFAGGQTLLMNRTGQTRRS